MPAVRTYKIFIGHSWAYSDDYWRVVQLLNEAPNFSWMNLSVPEHAPVSNDRLEYELRSRMRPADAFSIIAGMYAAHRGWIDFALQICPSNRAAIQNAATIIVGWNGSSIVQAIWSHALPSPA